MITERDEQSKPKRNCVYDEASSDSTQPATAPTKPANYHLNEPIVFFGSGPVAAASLRLIAQWAEVEAVITKPRPSHHRGEVPVLNVASELGLKTLTATDKRSLDELFATRTVRSRLAVLVDFGIIVSSAVIDYFELGIVNSHFSLLPEWRGADPITFSLLSGQPHSGVSLMLLVEKMDEGPLLAQAIYDIDPLESNQSLSSALIELSDQLLQQTLADYAHGSLLPYEQTEHSPAGLDLPESYSRKLTKQDGILDFTKPAVTLEREIRAYNEWPKSRMTFNGGVDAVITQAHSLQSVATQHSQPPGQVELDSPAGPLVVHTSDGLLSIDKLKPAGKNEMSAAEFIRGYGQRLAS